METEKIKKQPLSREFIYWMAGQTQWEADDLQSLFERARIYPPKQRVAFWLDMALLAAGVLLTICGIIFFFAYNWADMHYFVKLGLVAAALLGVGIFSLFQKEGTFAYQIGLFGLVGLTGALFALFGQIYQTGANAYDFFWGWSIMATAWTLISRFPPLWMFYLGLINATIFLYAIQVRLWQTGAPIILTLAVLNLLCWIGWEAMNQQKNPLFALRWWPRVVAFFSYSLLTEMAVETVFVNGSSAAGPIGLVLFLLVSVGIYGVYTKVLHDLAMLSFFGLAVIVFINSLIIRMFTFDNGADTGNLIVAFFLCCIVTILASIYGVKFLIQLNRSWKIESVS